MKTVHLVFRTVGERTSDVALELAKRHIQPDQISVIDHVTPFSEAVRRMLTINYTADTIVFVDADCLIMQDMRPFINKNDEPYVDCYVLDKFRGRIHAGVHITRRDVVHAMQEVEQPEDLLRYALRPESHIRHIALKRFSYSSAAVPFAIFHDFEQSYADIFAKYALRELRSRVPEQRAKLNRHMGLWPHDDLDFEVARHAIAYTRRALPFDDQLEPNVDAIVELIEALPQIAQREVAALNLPPQPPLTADDVGRLAADFNHMLHARRTKVFGIGLSRTGTKSLTSALDILGYTVVHNPVDALTFRELASGQYDLTLLGPNNFDGITDISGAAFYPQFDQAFPNSKFILTTRGKESWLNAMERHWADKPVFEDIEGQETKSDMRRFLRASVYGTYTFSRHRMAYVYDRHYEGVRSYFRDRPQDLLVLDICSGEGWDKLCTFLGQPAIDEPFPHVRRKMITKIIG